MANNEDMLPDSSPGSIGTRRVNRNPILIMIAIVITFLLVMVFVASQKANKMNLTEETPIMSSTNSNLFATELTSKHTEGIIPSDSTNSINSTKNETETPPLPEDEKTVDINSSINVVTPLLPDSTTAVNVDPERERIEMAKMQLFEQSLRSKTAVDNIAPAGSGSSNYSSNSAVQSREQMLAKIASVRQKINSSASSGDLSEAYKQRLEMIKNAGFVEGTGSELSEGTTAQNLGQGSWQLENKIEVPSPYVLRTGFVIPGTLISGINSELPGQIVAQVSQNIYDTATGKYLLIPQGSRLNGTYSSEVSFGQARAMVAWQRIIFPDGKALDIGSMPGADSAGYGGLNDRVNNHYLRIFGSAVLLSGVTAGISYSQDRHNSDDKSASSAMSEALGQQLGQTAMQLINKNMNIAPTIEIRPGYRFNIIVTKDIVFSKPYKSFDF
ncbi:MAG: conjugal transfer protein TrbI [Gilliamella sp.]|nr:conjugal transfer protein TrbI [Gilliamella sp.]